MKRGWFGGGLWKPKNVHSLEHLRYLYSVLSKNQVVQESNRSLLVESLRSIAEILIWGDQNDSSVFDFFLEKNMLSFFLKIMKQKCGSYVCVQLLQTLNILFENIRNETSLYYLLSNNHVNSIIIHKFDFSDEEVMAYYISFLKTLSFKLNSHTIHFFYHERTNDFPLYTEAIKFFHHPETMVRIAVRTLTLNVFRVEDESMLNFIRDRTAAPYFSNLVWFIGNHILELDACVRNDVDHNNKDRLADLVAEHLDHLHYLNDILELNITELNYVLADHLLNRLLVPLLVYSLCHQTNLEERPRVSRVVALFLLSQVFLIFSFSPLMRLLAQIILHADHTIFEGGADSSLGPIKLKPRFVAPEKSLEQSLPPSRSYSDLGTDGGSEESASGHSKKGKGKKNLKNRDSPPDRTDLNRGNSEEAPVDDVSTAYPDTQELVGDGVTQLNITDEEKENLIFSDICRFIRVNPEKNTSLVNRPFLQCIMSSLNCSENDYMALLSLCLLYALGHNPGLNKDLLSFSLTIQVSGPSESRRPSLPLYNSHLVDLLLRMVSLSAQYESKIRVVTLELALVVLKHQISLSDRSTSEAVKESNNGGLKDPHLAALEGAKEEATLLLRNFYKGEEIFLDMFEDEWRELHGRVLKVQFLLQDSSVLLPPTRTPLTGVDFDKRLPCGEVERARRAMRVFFLIREFCLDIKSERDTDLPLTNPAACVQVSDVLDLNNSDLIACVVIPREGQRTRRFLVIDVIQVILVEPDQRKMGWGVAKFVGFLQDLEVLGDKDDSRVLHVTIHRPSSSSLRSPATLGRPAPPLLAAKFVFDDHIRCMAAKQRLTKGRLKARQKKLHLIARLLELPNHLQPCPSPPSHALRTMRQEAQRKGSSRMAVGTDSRGRSLFHKSKFSHQSKGPGVALKTDTESVKDFAENIYKTEAQGSSRSKSAQAGSRSLSRPRNQPEDIPMDYLSKEGNDETKKSLKNKSMDKSRVASTDGNSKNTLVDLPMSSFSFCSVPEQVPFGRTSSSYISNRMPVLDSFPIPCPNFQASIQPSNKMSSEIGVVEKEEIVVLKDDYSSKTSTAETSFDSNSLMIISEID